MSSQVRSGFGLQSAVSVARGIKGRLRSFVRRRRRLGDLNEGEVLTAFWWGQGRLWAEQEASPGDLKLINGLAKETAQLSGPQAEAAVVSELKSVWRKGQPNSSDAFGWDEMNDQLPASALVAFVRGAGSIQQPKG